MPNPPSDRWKRSKDTTHRDPLPPSSPKERNSAPGHHRPPGKRPTPGEPNPRPTNDHPRDRWTHQEQGSHAHKRSVPEPASIPSPAPDVRTATVNRTHQEHLRSPEPPSGTAARPLHTYLRDPRIFLGTAGAALLLVIFIIGGSIFALRGTDDDSGMTGGSSDGFALTDDEVRNAFSINGIFSDCIMNPEFYSNAGVHRVEESKNGKRCEGVSESGDLEFNVFLDYQPTTNRLTSVKYRDIGAVRWAVVTNPTAGERGTTCYYYHRYNSTDVSIASDDSCKRSRTPGSPVPEPFRPKNVDRPQIFRLQSSGTGAPRPLWKMQDRLPVNHSP